MSMRASQVTCVYVFVHVGLRRTHNYVSGKYSILTAED